MLESDADSVRIALHLLGVTVWVGGQVVLGALVPVLRGIGGDAPKRAANRFALVAWPFFALAVVTGTWNLLEVDVGDRSTEYHVTLGLKLLVVAVSGLAAAVHSLTGSPAVRGITGGLGLVAGLGAVHLGVLLALGG